MIHALFLVVYLLLFALAFSFLRAYDCVFPRPIQGLDFVLLCLATFRLTELVTEDKIFHFLRAPFVTKKCIRTADGVEAVEEKPAGRGVRRVIGELIICPWCSGIWIATLLTFLYIVFPDAAYVLLLVLSAAAGGILLQIVGKFVDRSSRQ